ncbi:helix-turn-helix domain-containing protein [Brachyspira hyodysenteriae]|uniref:helix-turn-helix domain-containing protein n=1 Tax=Brachyspira hyodysenteriae TaxID=159 RepID=UPI0022CD8338|nr:helix-turn-helix domain-containing protein [Brachyspira hyodysenteriae]MCZ9850946.1 helix-turn-helix domain-containing protein [Brachyspira hyodysenteriae]MCZ9860301.1 helix-turn-helix domain-containing protein [Brachyspira hyodysenteriae]MCZ9869417.1 helix-turn-helix domain-containing protein [Brachyspira hyodysenteriae]MCZ9874675.1 helix-turn-helix domain-containing protein [Brachyspira hyodysenteriae]MCZ9879896.1 helix-turn-helix domain-containing protein [Brachyspira hyodysenteriae]
METIGQILKNAREKKGLTIEELEATTHIVAKFIKALENEEFDILPGEIYVKGFIKNLSDKLSLDADMVLERYNLQKNGIKSDQDLLKGGKAIKNIKKNKEPVKEIKETKDNKDNKEQEPAKEPVKEVNTKESLKDAINTEKHEEKTIKETNKKNKNTNTNNRAEADLLFMARRDLYKLRNKNKSVMPTVIIILAVIVVIAVIVFNWKNITGFIFPSNNKRQNRNEVEISKNIVDSKAKQSVKSGDVIYFKPLGISATIKFNSIGNVLHININGQDLSFSKSSPIILDLNGNGINDFKISVIEVYDNSATVEMEKLEENQMVNTGYTNDIETTAAMNTTNYNDTVSTNLLVINGETYIEQDTEKVDIRIEITAKHFVYIRYFIDSNRPATTNLLSGKTLYLEANDVVMLTIGNAGEVVVKVNGKIINVGAAGETVNKTIKWVKNLNDSTRYNLIMSDTK